MVNIGKLWQTNILLLNVAIEIVDLPSNSMVMFHSFLYVYQRGDHHLVGDYMEAARIP